MRKTLITFCVLIMAVGAMAKDCKTEEDHLKFMGIPICGTIKGFSKELIARTNAQPTRVYNGMFSFRGSFAGYDADLHVTYNKVNKEVYQAHAVVDSRDKKRAERIRDEFRESLMKKYPDSFIKSSKNENGDSIFQMWPKRDPKAKKLAPEKVYGEICLYILYNKRLNVHGVFLIYNDEINTGKYYEESKLADF